MPSTKSIIGIDIGTTKCCAAVFRGNLQMIPNAHGKNSTLSYVAFTESEGFLVGDEAKRQIGNNLRNTFFDTMRLIGRKFDDPVFRNYMKYWPFSVIPDKQGCPKMVEVNDKSESKTFFPEQILAKILVSLKASAESYLQHPVSNVVITVPALYSSAERQSIQKAAGLAGLNILRIMSAPAAAAMVYNFYFKHGMDGAAQERNVLVFDLGGGTCNVAVLEMFDNTLQVIAIAGDCHLGGRDFDKRMVNHFVKQFASQHKCDLSSHTRAINRLLNACENAKKTLSSALEASIVLENVINGIDLNTKITRACFEKLCADLLCSTLYPVEKALQNAKISKSDIHEVILVGGSSRIPKVQELLTNFFPGKQLNKCLNPDEAVARGAALQAAILNGVSDVKINRTLLLDCQVNTVGIETASGVMAAFIRRGTTIPTKTSMLFSNKHSVGGVLIQVYEGEHALTKDNNLLGEFLLEFAHVITEPQILVTFDINADGIMVVSAKECNSGAMKGIVIGGNQQHQEMSIVNGFDVEMRAKCALVFEGNLH